MTDEFTSFLKSLNVPLLTATEVATLIQLQKQWEHWKQHELEHAPLQVEPHQKAAYAAFLDNPTAENEQRLLVIADTNLTGTRYAVLRRACAALRGRIGAQAAEILRPVLERISAALDAEHTRRREAAEPIMSSKDRNPVVIESRKAIEHVDRLSIYVLGACGGKDGDRSPLVLADVLISNGSELTPDAGQ